ncbi:MAG: ATP-binding protein [Polaromonas sp.]|nr:MAG: ATP-binding protein [Polaromonas sp.]
MHTGLEQWLVALAQSVNPYQKQSDNRQAEIETLLRLLNQIDDRFDPEFLQIAGDSRVSLKVHGQVTELRHLSSGFASLLKMLQAIISGYANFTNEVQLAHVKGVVLIDEIESHLHVEWQSKIVLLLKKIFPNTTFFIATHAPLVLTQLEEGEAYQLHRDKKDGVIRSQLITAPNKQALIDVLREGFGVDVNALKRERMSPESQEAVKKRLLDLINDNNGAAT